MSGKLHNDLRNSVEVFLAHVCRSCEDASVQTLGISDKQQEPDNFFRRIFWPSNHPSDVDLLGQQGFWVCAFVAAVWIIQGVVGGHWIVGIFFALVFLLGGIGVREHSRAAAVCISVLYLVNVVGTTVLGKSVPGVLALAALGLLLANIRGTWIAARWKNVADEDDLPTRFNENWRDWLVDILPPRVWPRGRYAFFGLYAIAFLLMIVGLAAIAAHKVQPENPDVHDYVVTPEK
jgi:hypothetical protein